MKNRFSKVLETPLPVLSQVAVSRLSRRWSAAARRLRRGLPDRAVKTELRDDRRFFCAQDLAADRAGFLRTLDERWSGSRELAIQEAERALSHTVDLLGSGDVDLGNRIDWHRDFKSGKQWPRAWFGDIPEIDLTDDSDIKVPWELSRFYHFVALGKAYVISGEERYAAEFEEQWHGWLADNRPSHGVNWHCPMEVAIRAINLLWAAALFRGSPHLDTAGLAASLLRHGRFIRENLEFDRRVVNGKLQRMNGNHYAADLAGLVYLGVMLRGAEPERWLRFALKELEIELEVQVMPDGAHWELSPAYHRLVLEMLIGCGLLCQSNGIPLPPNMPGKVEAMLGFLEGYLRSDGRAPLVRDADDGRITPLGMTDYRDHRHLLGPGALLCGLAEVPPGALEMAEDVLWLCGTAGVERLFGCAARSGPRASRGYVDSGFYALRAGGGLEAFVVCASGGMNGRHASHAHNDCLSFELVQGAAPIFSDCGTYAYSGAPRWRNLFRSTEFHNTARVDGQEINRFSPEVLFAMENDARPRVTSWQSRPDRDELVAEHYGYQRLPQPVVHRRRFLLDKEAGSLLIEDVFNGHGVHRVEVFFTLAPGCRAGVGDTRSIRLVTEGASLVLAFPESEGWDLSFTDGWVSERYGRKEETRRLVLSRTGALPLSLQARVTSRETQAEAAAHDSLAEEARR
jgi:uncharacterized heparinase superfamily protein